LAGTGYNSTDTITSDHRIDVLGTIYVSQKAELNSATDPSGVSIMIGGEICTLGEDIESLIYGQDKVEIYGNVYAKGKNSDLRIISDTKVLIDGWVEAEDQVIILGGASTIYTLCARFSLTEHKLSAPVTFKVVYGNIENIEKVITLSPEDTQDNTSFANLVEDIQKALNAAGFTTTDEEGNQISLIRVSLDQDNHLVFQATEELSITGLINSQLLGLSDSNSSQPITLYKLELTPQENQFVLPSDIAFSVSVTQNGETLFYTITIDKDQTTDNKLLSHLAQDIQSALSEEGCNIEVRAKEKKLLFISDKPFTLTGVRNTKVIGLMGGSYSTPSQRQVIESREEIYFLDGKLPLDVKFNLFLGNEVSKEITISSQDTQDNQDLWDLAEDIQEAINNAEVDNIQVGVNNFKLMFISGQTFSIYGLQNLYFIGLPDYEEITSLGEREEILLNNNIENIPSTQVTLAFALEEAGLEQEGKIILARTVTLDTSELSPLTSLAKAISQTLRE